MMLLIALLLLNFLVPHVLASKMAGPYQVGNSLFPRIGGLRAMVFSALLTVSPG
jgi:hypothetical protein